MNASSSDTCCGVSSCSTTPWRAAGLADLLRGQAVHLEHARLDSDDRDVRADELAAKRIRLRRAHAHDVAGRLLEELLRRRVRDQAAAADDDQMLGGQRHLAHQMRRDEHGATLAREILEQIADPVDAFRVEAVDGLVEHHRLRIAEQRGRDAEALPHAERELPGALLRHLAQADEVDSSSTRFREMPWVCASASRWL